MKKIAIAAIVVLLIGAGLWIVLKNKSGQIRYTAVPVQSGSLQAMVTATGTVNAVKTVSVGTQISGTVKAIHVDYNSQVKKGQIIAEIDPSIHQAQVDQAKANLLAAKANVDKTRATQEDSKKTRDRNQQLFSKDLIAKADLDTSESNYESNKAQVSAAMAQVAQTEAALRYAETNLGYTRIISPVDGIVVSRSVDVGQTVAASFQTPTLFTIAQDLTKMQIDTNIDEADIGKIEKGQKVEFTVDAYPDNTFRGIVDEVRIAPITVSNVVTYDVVIRVDNTGMKLKPGMTANVSIIVASKDKVLKIPNSALRFKPSEKEVSAAKADVPKSDISGAGTQNGKTPRTFNKENGRPSDGRGRNGRRFADGAQRPSRSADEPDAESSGTGHASSGITVPRKYTVWVLEDGKPRQVIITVGISDGSFTEVVSGDLGEGLQVITGSSSKTGSKNNAGQSGAPPRFFH